MFRFQGIPIVIKRILLFVAVVIFSALQNTDGLLPSVFGARFFILIPLIISIGMFEGELAGLFYGMIAGCFWDVCSAGPDGFHGFYLALAGCLSGILVHFVMRNWILSQYCLCATATAIHSIIYWLATIYIPIGDSGYSKLLGFYLPSAIITTAFSFIIYYMVRFICTNLKENQAQMT